MQQQVPPGFEKVQKSFEALLGAVRAYAEGGPPEPIREAYAAHEAVRKEAEERASLAHKMQLLGADSAPAELVEKAVEGARMAKKIALSARPGEAAQWTTLGYTFVLGYQVVQEGEAFSPTGEMRFTAMIVSGDETPRHLAFVDKVAAAVGVPEAVRRIGLETKVDGKVHSFVWTDPSVLVQRGAS